MKPEPLWPWVTDNTALIHTDAHYSDHRFQGQDDKGRPWGHRERTVFGETSAGLSYDYSDRIQQWDYDKATAAWKDAVKKHGVKPRTAQLYETYLSIFFGAPVTLKHIIAGVNHSSGYPYLVFGYSKA